ncbi:MAG: AraC family transcriptional regulator [Vibrio sp.]
MNYLISHQNLAFPFLHTTARKKTQKHQLIQVRQGFAAVRLGKNEFIIQAGQILWLPFDCLTSLTYFPNSEILELTISARSQKSYSYQAGLLNGSPILTTMLNELAKCPFDVENQEQKAWLNVVNFELEKLRPTLDNTLTLEQFIATSKSDRLGLNSALLVREAFKMRSSGAKPEKIIETLFSGQTEQAQQLCLSIADKPLCK